MEFLQWREFDFLIYGLKTNDDCCTFLIGNKNKYKRQEGNEDRCAEGSRWGILKNGQWIMKNDSFLTMLKG